ncbi:glycosyltransferase family 1 protein [Candidatus Chlorohelix sp.]|uniref:glycosyltransferase family 4 protein n=1 Tax=Candidatus Chlorohelix sp. TaxID=3139201 RepID=UPI003067FAC7
MKRVGIDFTAAIRQAAGVGRHTRSLVTTMLEKEPNGFEFVLFYAGGNLTNQQENYIRSLEIKYRPVVSFARLPFSEPFLTRMWQRARVPFPLEWVGRFENPFPFPNQLGKLDIVHFPDFVMSPHRSGKDIVTVHDLSFIVVSECADDKLRRYLSEAVPRAAKQAERIIVVSESIKSELVERLKLPPEKIKVIYNGVSPKFHPLTDTQTLEEVRSKLGLPPQFALFVGTIEPRKNLARLVEAWRNIINTPQGKGRKLVLVGRRGWKYEPIFRRITELKMQDEIVWLDFVSDKDLPALYNLAELFVFPSLYEGFGIPPLEALACGTPALVSDNSALSEVFEGAAVMCNPLQVDSIAQGISQILTSLDGDHKLVEELRFKGLERAAQYTWENAAADTLELYQSLR